MLARHSVFLGSFVVTVASAVACGSSSSTTTSTSAATSTHSSAGVTGSSTSGTVSTSSSSSSTSTSTSGSTSTSTSGSSSTSGGGSTGAGGSPTCDQKCEQANPQGAAEFEGYELKECGCASASAPCATECASDCGSSAPDGGPSMSSPCGQCLLQQAGMGTASTCTVTAAFTDCTSTECMAFVQCGLGC